MNLLKKSQTNWKYILIVVILVFIASGVILWWMTKQEITVTQLPEIERTKVEQPKIELETLVLEEDEVETADWKIQSNNKLGYEIKYPEDWTFYERSCIAHKELSKIDRGDNKVSRYKIYIDAQPKNDGIVWFNKITPKIADGEVIISSPKKEIRGELYKKVLNEPNSIGEIIKILEGGYMYHIIFIGSGTPEADERNLDIFHQILSTFKVIEREELKCVEQTKFFLEGTPLKDKIFSYNYDFTNCSCDPCSWEGGWVLGGEVEVFVSNLDGKNTKKAIYLCWPDLEMANARSIFLNELGKQIIIGFDKEIRLIDLARQEFQTLYSLSKEEVDQEIEILDTELSPDKKSLLIMVYKRIPAEYIFSKPVTIEISLLDLDTLNAETVIKSEGEYQYWVERWKDNENVILIEGGNLYSLNIRTKKLTDMKTYTIGNYVFSNNLDQIVFSAHAIETDEGYRFVTGGGMEFYESGLSVFYNALILSNPEIGTEIIQVDDNFEFYPLKWSSDDKFILFYTKKVGGSYHGDYYGDYLIDGSEEYYIYNIETKEKTKINDWVGKVNEWFPNYTSNIYDSFSLVNGKEVELNERFLGIIR